MAAGYPACSSVLIMRGGGWFSPHKALARKRSAAAASRLADRRKSIVPPLESTTRYKYTHLPFTRMKVSSTRHLSLVGRNPDCNPPPLPTPQLLTHLLPQPCWTQS